MVRTAYFTCTLMLLLPCGAPLVVPALSCAQQRIGADNLEDAEKTMVQLQRQWRGQRSAVINGRFRFRIIRTSRVRSIEREEVQRFISSVDLVATPDDLRLLYDLLCSDKVTGPPWATCELVVEDNKSKETLRLGLEDAGLVYTNAFDGKSHVVQELRVESKDAGVFDGEISVLRLRLEDMRFLPPDDSNLLRSYQIAESSPERVKLVSGDDSFIADPRTGFIHSVSAVAGNTRIEYQQYGQVRHGDGAIFPAASIRLQYSNNRLQQLTAITIGHVEINEDLATDAFAVSSPAETTVIDHRRESSNGPRVFKTTDEVTDVVQFATQQARTAGQSGPPSHPGWGVRAMFLISAFILLGIVAYIGIRHHRTHPDPRSVFKE